MGIFGKFFRKREREETGGSFLVDEEKWVEMTSFVEEREGRLHLPSLRGKSVLEIAPRLPSLLPILQEKGASPVARVGGNREKGMSEAPFIMAHWETLPFLDASWDFVVLRKALLKSGGNRVLQEVSRVAKPKAMVFMSDLHPFSLRVQAEHLQSPVTEEGQGPGFERYFKWFGEADLEIASVHEVFFDGSLRKMLVSEARQGDYDRLRKTPFLIQFFLRKTT